MTRMPDFEHALGAVEGFAGRILHHDAAPAPAVHPYPGAAPQAPATQPVTVETTQPEETPVSLATIANAIKNGAENAEAWVKQVTETHLPAILAIATKYENDPIVQALETAVLPPEVSAGLASTIRELAKLYPAPAEPAATPASDTPQQPAAA